MDAYERAMAMMGAQLDEGQKRRLRDAASLLDQGNSETRRTSFADQQTGIVQDTQQLAGQGLAGNAYSAFQSGAQERRVNTRNGVFDLTQNTLNTQESTSLVTMGQNMIAQARAAAAEAARKRQKELEAQRQAKASFAPLAIDERAFMDNQPETNREKQKIAVSKTNPWHAAYDAVVENTGSGAQGVMNLITKTTQQYKAAQTDVYNSVRKAGGVGTADTMFGINPIKNTQDTKKAAVAADVIKLQQEKYARLDKATGTANIGEVDKQISEIDAAISTARYSLQYATNAQQIVNINKQIDDLKQQKASLEESRTGLNRRMLATIYSDYMKIADNTDFKQKSKVDTTVQSDFYRGVNGLNAKNDPYGLVKSLDNSVLPSYAETSLDGKGYKNGVEAAKYLTDEEKDIYNYIFATQGEAKAQEYVTDTSTLLNARYASEEYDKFSKMAEEKPILASAMTIFGGLTKAQGLLYSFTAKGEIDQNSPFLMASRVNQIIRGEVAANIADGIGRLDRYSPTQLKKMGYSDADITRIESGDLRAKGSEAVGAALAFLYQTGMSVGDFVVTSAAGGPSALMIMGTGAASDTVLNAKQRGATDGQALSLGIVAGIAEIITEKFSLDHFYKMAPAGKLANLKNILAQMGIEATEEMASEFINIIGDGVVMADNSNSRLMLNAYMAGGMSYGEAWLEVFKQNTLQVMMAGLGGAISGGVIGGGKLTGMRVISSAKNGKLDLNDPQTKKELSAEYVEEQEKQQQDAAKDAANRVQNINLGDLKATDENPVKATLLDVATAELKGKGEADTVVKDVKSILEKTMSGEPITAAERMTIISNPVLRDAFNITEPVPKMRVAENGKIEAEAKTRTTNNPRIMSEDDYLGLFRLGAPISDYTDDKWRIPNGETQRQMDARMKEAKKAADEYARKREEKRQEYKLKVENGELRTPTLVEQSMMTAFGDDGNEAVNAARRSLTKRGYNIEEILSYGTFENYIKAISGETNATTNTETPAAEVTSTERSAAPEPKQTIMKEPEQSEPAVEKPSAKSTVYKEQLAKSFVKDVSNSVGLTKETGATKELATAINIVMENGKFSSDEQNALFEKITQDLPEGTNAARARIAFDDAVFNVRMSLGLVDRYEADRHAKSQQKAERAADANDMPLVKKALEDKKPLARQLQKLKDDNVFTQADTNDINYILDGGEVNLEGRTNAAAFKQRLEVERKLRAADRIISDYNKQRKKGLFDQAVRATSGSESWKDKTFGLQYSTETMERNFEDIVIDPAQAELLTKTYMTPIHDNEADSTRFKRDYRARVDALNLNNAEKKAVQLRGEGSSADAIKAQIGEGEFKKVNMEKVNNAVEVFRSIYDELITAANEALIRNGYEPIEYRKNYFPHFNDPEADTVMKKVAQALGVNVSPEELPTDIAGLTATFKPGKTWFGHLLERKGETTTLDAVKGFETYITGVSDIVHHTDDIQRWRALESAIRYEHSNEAIRKRMLDVMANTSYDPDLQQAEMDAIFNEKQGHLGKLVTEIREYTNLLANKKSMHDRSAEADLGRKMYAVVNTLNSRVAANMVAGNIGVALTNFIPLTQAWASTDTKNLVMGMTQSLASILKDDGFSDKSNFVTNRKGSESLDMTGAQKASRIAAIPFTLVDNFVAESIVRAQTMQNIEKGMSPEDALQAADEWAGRIMADRSKGALPTYFKRSNPLSKVFGMFQVEVNNQLRYAFKDLPRVMRDRGLAAVAVALFKLCLGAWLYNEVTEPLTGRRAALDPVNILMEFGLDLTKKDLGTATLTQFMLGKGETPWKLQEKDVSTSTAIENLWGNLMDQTPFVGTFLGGEGGRIPISSAIPDMWAIGKDVIAAMSGDGSWKKAGETARTELVKPFVYLVPPFGGGQAKKTFDGIKTVARGGSFKLSDDGEQRIQFTTEQGLREYLQAAVFGKWSLPAAQEYVRNGFDMMTTRESEGYKAARAAGIDTDYMRARAELAKIKPTKDQFGETIDEATTLQRRALMNWPGLTAEQKKMFDKYLIANENGRSYDYSNAALLDLEMMDRRTYEKAVNAQRQGIAPETYLDYVQLKKEYDAANEELKQRGQETVSVNERLHDAIWDEENMTETQRYQLEAAITGESGWMDKAVLAARIAVRNEKFYGLVTKVRNYPGSEPAEYTWAVIRSDKTLRAEQQLKLQELIGGTDNKTKMDKLNLAGVPMEPAYRYLALYRDYKAKDGENEMDYSDSETFKLAVSKEYGLDAVSKMKITDIILGSDSTLYKDWKAAKPEQQVPAKIFYGFQMKYLQTDGKDANGKSVNYLKKNRLKSYLKTLGLTQDQMEYLLFSVGGYTKW